MNVLGLSFGRNMSNCDVMTKDILLKCKEAGHNVNFINVNKLTIKPCTGCIACVVSMTAHLKNPGKCVMKDDLSLLEEALMEADAVILACPTFELGATGLYRVICDRLGPSHDVTFRQAAIDEGLDIDPRSVKKRVCAMISVGGAMTENWTVFTLPTMYSLPMSLGMDVIDMINYYGAMGTYNVAGNQEMMMRVGRMASNMIDALDCFDDDEKRGRWRGENEGVCPVCHLDMLTVSNDGTKVECPVCGIEGVLDTEGGNIHVSFSEKEQARSRLTYAGKLEHSTEIKTRAKGPETMPDLHKLLEPYRWEGKL